eukprot:TRINITY_DN3986_c0_g1_i1.p1 TRINITY_DN3986_c0_g1~~TRINITY_DN3986_c0_g1_i1.p1  ORF type:complete len:179 (-),score=35.37 TRINITY_DN3986_c0_g1_i1:103-639(-)
MSTTYNLKQSKDGMSSLKKSFVPSEELRSKLEKSADFFKSTRVNTCQQVKVVGGQALAQPYHPAPKKLPAEMVTRSSEIESFSHSQHRPRPSLSVSSKHKPLERYNPNAYRNRLPLPDVKMPLSNSSVVQIGDRGAQDRRHFVSTNRNTYGNFGKVDYISNTGILAARTKWHHHQQDK